MKISCSKASAATLAFGRKPNLLALAALAALTGLTACGGADDPTLPVATPPAPAPVAPVAPVTPTAPAITSAPQSLTVGEGASASFNVSGTSNAGTLRYEWALNGASNITGATAPTYTIPATTLADDGKQVFARLINDIGSTVSAPVTLTVNQRVWATAVAPDHLMQTALTGEGTQAVAIDSLGHTFLVYGHRQDNGSVTLRWAHKRKGQAAPDGSSPLGFNVLAPNASMQTPRLAAGPDGTMLAIWREGVLDEGGNAIHAALYRPGTGLPGTGSWLALGRISTDGVPDADMPAVARIGPNQFEVVWRQVEQSGSNIMARRLDISGTAPTWAPIELVESAAATAMFPMIASDGNGNAIITFSTLGTTWQAWANTRTAAESAWNPASAQEFSGLVDSYALVSNLTMNSHGRAVVLFNSDQTRVYVRQYQFGGTQPGWQGSAAYVANRWESLDQAVQPVVLLDNSSETRFTILSIHNNGAYLSRWPCVGQVCGEAQTFLNAGSGGINDFVAGHDTVGNLLVVAALGQDFGNPAAVMSVRHHAALDRWLSPGHGGVARPSGKLQMSMHPDGSATTLLTTADGELRKVVSADFR